MPHRTDLRRILLLGAGPIVIGQACEFDYSGTQAVRALKALGYEVVLVNSNPASIMTDPRLADATYIEPLVPEVVASILRKERPDAILPTLGGQTALNLSMALHKSGILGELGVEMLGASPEAIAKAEDRGLFRACLDRVGVASPRSYYLRDLGELETARRLIGTPCVLRPAFTLGGSGSALVERDEDFAARVETAVHDSPVGEVLVEESLAGWKEYELEVMRDGRDNVVIVCSIENLDPMGVHTGDSITVAPQQTLTDREYQAMRRAAIDIIREVGVATGGCNIQFAVDPRTGRMVAIEANPRVSRSSALASKATGFPIAKIAAQLAVGLTLDEIQNDITGCTPASYEPSLDYIVVKIPRFAFEKFPGASHRLGTAMQSVGEVMALGRTFLEALQKGFRSLESGYQGLGQNHRADWEALDEPGREEALRVPTPRRLFYAWHAFAEGWSLERVASLTAIDPWFLRQILRLVEVERRPAGVSLQAAKRIGFSDPELRRLGVQGEAPPRPAFLAVDTCAGEFPAKTPYFYSTFEGDRAEDDATALGGDSVLIIGSGPNRIGQGIEFDCLCVQAAMALRARGLQAILMNSNPETVSTDYDVSSRLYFEPLTLEHVLGVLEREKPRGVILQLGGQTPLKLASALGRHGVPVLGTPVDAIDVAEDRERFGQLAHKLDLRTAPWGMAHDLAEAQRIAAEIGYPVLARPSYVLSGSAMRVASDERRLVEIFPWAQAAGDGRPVLIDKFLEDALELDVDVLSDGSDIRILGIMEQVEQAGVHSGDSTCFIPARSVAPSIAAQIAEDLKRVASSLGVVGFMNAQYAIRGQGDEQGLYLLEVNPRASRTVPYLSKAFGVDFVELAVELMLGRKLTDLPTWPERLPYTAVKQVVLPYKKLAGFDPMLGPEMRSTGEVMGIDRDRPGAFLKSILAAGYRLPVAGQTVYLEVPPEARPLLPPLAGRMAALGLKLASGAETAEALRAAGLPAEACVDPAREMHAGRIGLLLHTDPAQGAALRKAAIREDVALVTTLEGAAMFVEAMERRVRGPIEVRSLQEWHADLRA